MEAWLCRVSIWLDRNLIESYSNTQFFLLRNCCQLIIIIWLFNYVYSLFIISNNVGLGNIRLLSYYLVRYIFDRCDVKSTYFVCFCFLAVSLFWIEAPSGRNCHWYVVKSVVYIIVSVGIKQFSRNYMRTILFCLGIWS